MSLRTAHRNGWLLFLILLPFILPQSSVAQTRQWTDKSGQTTSASFVRISGNKAVLKRGRRILQVPLSDLSQEDRDYIDGLKKRSGTRNWTVNGRKLRGAFRSYENGSASIDLGSRTREIPIDSLDSEDVDHIRGLLSKSGKLDDLAASDPIKRTSIAALSNSAVEHHPYTWTNNKGKEVEATFVRIDGEDVILRREKDGKELPVPLSKLSLQDQAFAKAEKMRDEFIANSAQQHSRRRNNPRMQTPPRAIGSFPGRERPGGASGASQAIDDLRAKARAEMEEHRKQREARRLAESKRAEDIMDRQSARVQEQMERFQRESAERAKRQQESMANINANMNHSAVESAAPSSHNGSQANTSTPFQPPSTADVNPSLPTQEMVYVCSGCNTELPAHIGAGDRCPKCDITFSYEEHADGTRTYSTTGRITQSYRFVRLGIIALGVIGLIVRFFRGGDR